MNDRRIDRIARFLASDGTRRQVLMGLAGTASGGLGMLRAAGIAKGQNVCRPYSIPNRPFSIEPITGLMLPDGIFETAFGLQTINAHLRNELDRPIGLDSGASDTRIWLTVPRDSGIRLIREFRGSRKMPPGSSRLLTYEADFSNAKPGVYEITFEVGTTCDITKKIFVTSTEFDPQNTRFNTETPEGTLQVVLNDLVRPDNYCYPSDDDDDIFINDLGRLSELFQEKGHDPNFRFCPPGYLVRNAEFLVTPRSPYEGQYGELPFQDPWWKVLGCVVVVGLLIAASYVSAEEGEGDVIVTQDIVPPPDPEAGCCGTGVEGGSSSYTAAGLVVAAAAVATLTAMYDARDPFRRGQDNTAPVAGELTTGELVKLMISYPEPVALGQPFAVGADWEYTRFTTGVTYSHAVSEVNTNLHVLSSYKITAPDTIRRELKEPFTVKGEFFGPSGEVLRGDQLLVQCFLAGPNGERVSFGLQDSGIAPDERAGDGTFTGNFQFDTLSEDDVLLLQGSWAYWVIAQDVNSAKADLSPEEAAQIIGGMVLTQQLTITFDAGTCPFVTDGLVNVV